MGIRRKHPKSVRAAIRRGWHLVELSCDYNQQYIELCNWIETNTQGLYRSENPQYFTRTKFGPRFAFEIDTDATYFILRWPPCLSSI